MQTTPSMAKLQLRGMKAPVPCAVQRASRIHPEGATERDACSAWVELLEHWQASCVGSGGDGSTATGSWRGGHDRLNRAFKRIE